MEIGVYDKPLFPITPSRYMALCSGVVTVEFCEVWDLERVERIGRISELGYTKWPYALSPDGGYFAAWTHRTSEDPRDVVNVWSIDTGALACTLVPEKAGMTMGLGFAGPRLLVSIAQRSPKPLLQLWDPSNGRLLRSLDLEDGSGWGTSTAVSPGGRYLVKIDEKIRIYDLLEGKLAGEIQWAARSSAAWWNCRGVSFSPDGAELVAVVQTKSEVKFFRWDLATGEMLQEKSHTEPLLQSTPPFNALGGSQVHGLPSVGGWLLDSSRILRAETGDVIWEYPERQYKITLRRPLGARRLLEMQALPMGGLIVRSVDLPMEELAAAATVIDEGGKMIDVNLPPISTPDIEGVRRVTVPGEEQAWSVEPDPAASPKSLIPRPVRFGQDRVHRLLFSSPESPSVVVLHADLTTWKTRFNYTPAVLPDRLTAYDLITGEASETMEIPRGGDLKAVSPDGQLAALTIGRERDRIDVWSIADRTHAVGWRPYADEDVKLIPRHGDIAYTARTITWVGFVDPTLVLTLSQRGRLILWQLPNVKAVYEMEFDPWTSAVLTPGRKYAAVFQGTRLRFFEPKSGDFCGDLPLPYKNSGGARADQIAFSPSGRDLAMVVPGGEVSTVLHWDLQSGKLVSEIPVAKASVGLDWSDADHLITGGGLSRGGHDFGGECYLVDVRRKAIVWKYRLDRGCRLSQGPDQRQWLLARTNAYGAGYLGALAFSDPQMLAKVDAEFPANMPPLVGPGSKVRVVISGMVNSEVKEALESSLRRNGCEVTSAAPVTLMASCSSTGSRTVSYQRMFSLGGDGAETFSLQVTGYKARLAFVDSSGKTLWEREGQFGSGGPGRIFAVSGDEDPQEYLNRMASHDPKGPMVSFFGGTRIPRVLYFQPTHDKGQPGLGTTTLDVFGLFNLKEERGRAPTTSVTSGREGTAGAIRAGSVTRADASRDSAAQPTGERFVRKTYLGLLTDDTALEERLKWFPAAKRPSIGLRWGLGVVLASQADPPKIRSSDDLAKLTGPIGPALIEQLQTRMGQGAFGKWPENGPPGCRKVAILGAGTQPELVAVAKKDGLDVLVLFTLRVRPAGSGRRMDMSMRVRLLDVASDEALWTSESVSSGRVASARQSGSDPLLELHEAVLRQVDESFRLAPMPTLAPEHVRGRVAGLVEGSQELGEDERLRILVELRYYQGKELLSRDAAAKAYDQVLGEDKGSELAAADGPGRRALLHQWLGS
jgi:WD40 repeat protein